MEYNIHYGIINSKDIFNLIHHLRDHEKRRREKRLPTHMCIFFDEMKKSVMERGVLTPILTVLVPKIKEDENFAYYKITKHIERIRKPIDFKLGEKILMCNKNGGTRLWAAQKENQKVPVIVSDFTKSIRGMHKCINEDCIMSHFKYRPGKISLLPDGVMIYNIVNVLKLKE